MRNHTKQFHNRHTFQLRHLQKSFLGFFSLLDLYKIASFPQPQVFDVNGVHEEEERIVNLDFMGETRFWEFIISKSHMFGSALCVSSPLLPIASALCAYFCPLHTVFRVFFFFLLLSSVVREIFFFLLPFSLQLGIMVPISPLINHFLSDLTNKNKSN